MKAALRFLALVLPVQPGDVVCPLFRSFLRSPIFLCAVSGWLLATVSAASNSDPNEAFWKSVYEENRVLKIDIAVTREAWDAMQPPNNRRGGRGGQSENGFSYVKAAISIDGQAFEDAGLRFKGNSSYRFSQGGFKRPLKIDTNRFVKGQKLYGRTKLNLSNSFLDSAYMKEKLAYEVYRAAGIPTPGVGWAAVTLSIEGVTAKQPLGVYVLVEQVDSNYIKRSFDAATAGSLLMKPEISSNWQYPGEEPEAYEPFGIKIRGKDDTSFARFGELLKLIHSGSDSEFAQEIGQRMDLDQLAGYLAASSLLANIDSYIGMPHNYYLLVDKADNRVRLLPWDLNESFGTFTMGSSPEALVDWDIDRPWVAELRLVERLFEIESFRKQYRAALVGLMRKTFTQEKLFARVAAFQSALMPYLNSQERADLRMGIDGDANGYNRAVERSVLAIKPFIVKRIASVAAQLAGRREGTRVEGRRRGGPGRERERRGPRGGGPRP